MKEKENRHQIDGVFVLGLLVIYAVAILIVLYLGIESYQKLVERDEASYNQHLGTEYIAAKIHGNDVADGVKTGGFSSPTETEGPQTLHLYQTIDGEQYEVRIYYYEGYLMELFTGAGVSMEPEDGSQIMEASGLAFTQKEDQIQIDYTDSSHKKDSVTIMLRSQSEVTP